MTRAAILPGTYDPITCGHTSLACRAAALFGRAVVVVMNNTEKRTLFSFEERLALARAAFEGRADVEVVGCAGLLADFAADYGDAVLVKGDMLGDVVFYGKGAGKLPTASAVVADVIDALKDGSKIHDSLFWKPAEKLDHQLMDTAKYSYYIRTAGVPAAALPNVAGPGKLVFDYGDSAAYLIEAATAADLEAVAAKLKVLGGRLALVLKKLPE